MKDIERVLTDGAPKPVGHYSQGVAHGDLVFVSGQLPVTRDGKVMAEAGFEEQARLALANLLAVVKAAGSAPERVLKVTVFIAGIEHWPKFNLAYAEAFGDAKPARSVVPVPALHYGCLVEIEAIAVR